jgi:sarcosine oxidase, subunit alpha
LRPHDPDLEIRHGWTVQGVRGARGVEGVIADGGGNGTNDLPADALLVAGGFTPTIHLYCQAGGMPRWNADKGFHVPGAMPKGFAVAGGANGTLALDAALAEGHAAGGGSGDAPRSTGPSIDFSGNSHRSHTAEGKRVWVDMLSDVKVADIGLAAREGFRSVEHLKRYTTLGMAPDQGKTSNVNGLCVLAATTGTAVADLGVTTFRTPYVPVSFATLAGRRGGERMHPLRRLPAESAHRRWGAILSEYGGWLRPAHYPALPQDGDPISAEARATRQDVTVFDGSSLGKIEVLGPQAGQLLDFVCYHRVSHLRPGQMRYGYMLRETGGILDDGIVVRADENRFIVSCSSAHVGAVADSLEEWRQARFDSARVHIHNVTAQWGTLTMAGPGAKALLARIAPEVGFADLRHMGMAQGKWMGRPCRIARASFSGERSYEVSVPSRAVADLWHALFEVGRDMRARPLGIEALSILRAEKGYPIVGRDTEATTMPQDLGAGGPRQKRTDEFVGRRALFTADGARHDRRQLVGIAVDPGEPPIPIGAHAVETHRGRLRSIGFVTTSHASPNVDRPVALALVDGGASRHGEAITLQHLGARRTAILTHPCVYDREGARLDT